MPGNKGMTYQKKDCEGCKALRNGYCCLGYGIVIDSQDPLQLPEPVVPCPKPRTKRKLRAIQETISKGNKP